MSTQNTSKSSLPETPNRVSWVSILYVVDFLYWDFQTCWDRHLLPNTCAWPRPSKLHEFIVCAKARPPLHIFHFFERKNGQVHFTAFQMLAFSYLADEFFVLLALGAYDNSKRVIILLNIADTTTSTPSMRTQTDHGLLPSKVQQVCSCSLLHISFYLLHRHTPTSLLTRRAHSQRLRSTHTVYCIRVVSHTGLSTKAFGCCCCCVCLLSFLQLQQKLISGHDNMGKRERKEEGETMYYYNIDNFEHTYWRASAWLHLYIAWHCHPSFLCRVHSEFCQKHLCSNYFPSWRYWQQTCQSIGILFWFC